MSYKLYSSKNATLLLSVDVVRNSVCRNLLGVFIDSDGDDLLRFCVKSHNEELINGCNHRYKIRGFVATRFDNYFCYVLVHPLGIRQNRQQTIVTWMSFLAGKTNTAMSNDCIVIPLTQSRQEGST